MTSARRTTVGVTARRLAAAALAAGALAAPLPAAAFSSATTFERSTTDPDPMDPQMLSGGGGGRYFTGSVLDGYTCEVCHRLRPDDEPVPASEFEVAGWPDEGYVPGGEAIEIEVTFPDETLSAAALEVVREDGTGTGELAIAPNPVAAELCPAEAPEMPYPAGSVREIPQSRDVAVSDACAGVRRLRVRWTPPPQSAGAVWLNVAVVAANGDGDTTGDTVYTFARLVPPVGEAVVPGDAGTECATRPGRGGGGPWAPLGLAVAALALLRRRARA